MHFLTLGFSTPTHKVTVQPNYPQLTPNTSQRNDAYIWPKSQRHRTWLILSLGLLRNSGGMGKEAKIVFKRIASLASIKNLQDTPYSKMINWIRCRLSFSLLRSSLLCIRGTHSHTHNARALKNSDISIELALCEDHLNYQSYIVLTCVSLFIQPTSSGFNLISLYIIIRG